MFIYCAAFCSIEEYYSSAHRIFIEMGFDKYTYVAVQLKLRLSRCEDCVEMKLYVCEWLCFAVFAVCFLQFLPFSQH